ncbi:MAG: ATP-dependent 6-phosphofructokinase, partial [Planctomycetes bacterium]|nr:ATP-dependent 6-phosphofructokinase [Planctomycetota bacterium]
MPTRKKGPRCIGVLTSGGDCPGLNAAIRGVVKACVNKHGMQAIGFLDGFRGLVENRSIPLDDRACSGILTLGGTILGTSRDKPHKMPMGGQVLDMTATAVANARKLGIDCLVCLGGGGTQKNALQLSKAGLPVVTLPKTIDNDVFGTDVTFGFDTALDIATEAIDRLHSTATSHQRLIVCEIMGHNAGWLTLGAGIAGGADVVLIPELPYDLEVVADHLCERRRNGKRFSPPPPATRRFEKKEKGKKKEKGESGAAAGEPASDAPRLVEEPMASRLARRLQQHTGIEARVTSLGHVQRGGAPSPADRLLCTRLGTAAAQAIAEGLWTLRRGQADVAVVGGHDSMLHPLGLLSFVVLGALSPDRCRPFDRR